ncbi:MAG: 50S ribosomal protein L20 [Chitinispirillaceae bacterium]|nr:50S ribosomal protein L20 [Chitinispirillaceae bacterium]
MPRAKNRVASRAKRKKLLAATAGNYGKRGNCYTIAKDAFIRGGVYAYSGRKQKKRQFHALWIMRINAAARLNGLPYGKFMAGLKAKNIDLDRKTLAHLALHEPDAFKSLVESVKS